MTSFTRRAAVSGAASLVLPGVLRGAPATEISFYFPVAVGGPITKIIDGYVNEFQQANPDIKVTPIYSGTYQDTLTKAMTAVKAGSGPDMAVLLSTDVFSLIDANVIVPIDSVFGGAEDRVWLGGFYPVFLRNGQINRHLWGVPFQRSTIVLYWNKDAFRAAGLDPEVPPANWQEHADFAVKLTRANGGQVESWGTQIPSTGFAYWLFQALAIEAGGTLANPLGTTTAFDSEPCIDALRYWIDLNTKYHAHPPGVVEWGTTPRDFLEQKAAMIWTTTGNLSNIRASAKFPFGVAMLPQGKRRGSPTGGGNFYVFNWTDDTRRQACLRLLRWLTAKEQAARWGIDTGYVATRPDAWETQAMKDYVAGFPAAAVARDQLEFAEPELSTHDNQRVTQGLNDALQAALNGTLAPDAALAQAQSNATRLLKNFR